MAKSLIEELPRIVSEGRREAAQILERLSSGTQIGLQTNELVLPSKDVSGLFKGSTPQIPNAFNMAGGDDGWMNRLIYSDNLLAMQALMKEEKIVYQRDTLRYPVKIAEGETIDLNINDTSLYKKVPGIGSYYAHRIADYVQQLGGFVSIDQLDEIEGFPQEAKKYFSVGTSQVRQLNVNRLSLTELKRHPYINYYQAKAITDYRRLHGPLHSLDDLRLLPEFPVEAIKRLEPYVCF